MIRRKLAGERGDGILEFVGMLALTAAVIGGAAYVLFFRENGDQQLTPQQQAYVAAVATQQADAYIRAVETQRAGEPPAQQPVVAAPPPQSRIEQAPQATIPPPAPTLAPAAPPPPPPPPPPAPAPTSPPPPPPPAPAPAPTSPPPAPPAKPPMATCVGYMVGITSTGVDACNQITQNTSYNAAVRNCIYDIISGAGTTSVGQAACVQAALVAGNPYLSDCFLGLSGESFYGRASCLQYYRSS